MPFNMYTAVPSLRVPETNDRFQHPGNFHTAHVPDGLELLSFTEKKKKSVAVSSTDGCTTFGNKWFYNRLLLFLLHAY